MSSSVDNANAGAKAEASEQEKSSRWHLEVGLDYSSKKAIASLIAIIGISLHYLFFPADRGTYSVAENVWSRNEPQIIEEDGCSSGWGMYIPDVWDHEDSQKAVDILNEQKKIRGRGSQMWT